MNSIVSAEGEYLFLLYCISFLLCCQIVCRAAAPGVVGESLHFIPQHNLYFSHFGHAVSASYIYCFFFPALHLRLGSRFSVLSQLMTPFVPTRVASHWVGMADLCPFCTPGSVLHRSRVGSCLQWQIIKG